MILPSSIRLVWDDRAALALSEEEIRLLVDYCGPRLLAALRRLHDFGYVEHRRLKANEARA